MNTKDQYFLPCDAILSAVYAVVLCVCRVTLQYCIKTAKRRITQITPQSRVTSFMTTKFTAKFEWDHMGATNAGVVGKNSPLSTKNAL